MHVSCKVSTKGSLHEHCHAPVLSHLSGNIRSLLCGVLRVAVSKYVDIQIAHPGDWVDRSIVALSMAPDPSRKVLPNVLVTKDFPEDLGTAQEHADKTLVLLAKQMRHFELISSGKTCIDGVDGVELLYTWTGNEGSLKQRQIFVVCDGKVFSIVNTALSDDFEEVDEIFQQMLKSITFG